MPRWHKMLSHNIIWTKKKVKKKTNLYQITQSLNEMKNWDELVSIMALFAHYEKKHNNLLSKALPFCKNNHLICRRSKKKHISMLRWNMIKSGKSRKLECTVKKG